MIKLANLDNQLEHCSKFILRSRLYNKLFWCARDLEEGLREHLRDYLETEFYTYHFYYDLGIQLKNYNKPPH